MDSIAKMIPLIMKSEFTLTKESKARVTMSHKKSRQTRAMGISFSFAGTEQDDLIELVAVMLFDSVDVQEYWELVRNTRAVFNS